MEKMLDIHRDIVRAVMGHSDWTPYGAWDRVEYEEYGSYLYVNPDVDPSDPGDITEDTEVMVCTLTEDDGDIRLGKMKEFKKEVRGEYDFIETLLEYSTIYNSIEESIALRYALPAIVIREDHPRLAEIQDYLYQSVAERRRMIRDKDICFPSYQQWCEFVQETIEEAKREFPDEENVSVKDYLDSLTVYGKKGD